MPDKEPPKTETSIALSSGTQIKDMIYTVRGQQVMLDSDLAELYGVETKRLNEAASRNSKRFPERFCFSHHAATDASVRIMDAFVEMRHFIADNARMFEQVRSIDRRLDSLERSTGERFERVFDYMGAHEAPGQKAFSEGQAYDAFELPVSLVQGARREIALVDGHADTGTLNVLSKKQPGVSAAVWTPARGASRSPSLRTPPSLARLSTRLASKKMGRPHVPGDPRHDTARGTMGGHWPRGQERLSHRGHHLPQREGAHRIGKEVEQEGGRRIWQRLAPRSW